jgi:hypothetical protein
MGARPMDGEKASVLAPSFAPPIDDRPPLAKSDRLPWPYHDTPAAKPVVQTPPAVPDPAITPKITPEAKQAGDLPSQPAADASEVTTWHWHAGSKITKQTTVAPRDRRKAD